MSDTLQPFTARVLRRMAWRHAAPWLARGLAAGLAAAAALLLIAHVAPWAEASWWALAALAAPTLAGALVALATRPAPATALRRADHLLGLRDRLTTAWEYRQYSGDHGGGREVPILRLQRADLIARAGGLDLRAGLPLRPRRREMAAPAAGVVLLLVALLLPNPQNGVLAARATAHARIARAATRIDAARHATMGLPPATTAALTKADKLRQAQIARILARLRKELVAARTSAQAYKALARAQDALRALGNSRAAQRNAQAALAAALARDAATRPLANAVRGGNPAAIARASQKLAEGLPKMSPAGRASLARALQSAAQSAGADSAASPSLQQAATALAQGDQAGARAALQQAGKGAAADAARGAQQSALDQANASLDSARNDVSGLNGDGSSGPPGQATGKGGATTGAAGGAGKGSGKGGDRSGQGGKGQGQGSGSGQGQGQGSGSGSGSGRGSGSGSGAGGSGGGGRSGNASGGANGNRGDRVYVPAPQGNGRSTTSKGTDAAPAGGAYQPLTSVLPSYERAARAELNNGSVPAADRSLVSTYFDRLHHGGK